MEQLRLIGPHLASFLGMASSLTVWLLMIGLVLVPLERFFSLRPAQMFRAGFLTDLGYYFINGIVPATCLGVPLAAVAWVSHRVMPGSFAVAFAHLPLILRILIAMVVAEVGLYWGHRWSHEIPLLWRFHAVHHSARHVDWLVNSRGHPVDFVVTRLFGLVPLTLLGLTTPANGEVAPVAVVVMLLGPAWGFFIHANVRWRFGPLEWLIATPAFHHWHHNNDSAALIDKNYAPMFPWMDRLFGTFYLPPDRHPAVYGTDTAVSAGLVGQLLGGFAAPACYSIDRTASAAASAGLPEAGRSSAKASVNP